VTASSHGHANCSTAARSRSHSPITTAIKPSLKPDGTLSLFRSVSTKPGAGYLLFKHLMSKSL
jgi:hypothetical protein